MGYSIGHSKGQRGGRGGGGGGGGPGQMKWQKTYYKFKKQLLEAKGQSSEEEKAAINEGIRALACLYKVAVVETGYEEITALKAEMDKLSHLIPDVGAMKRKMVKLENNNNNSRM